MSTIYYTRCPAPTATGLAAALGTLAPELERRHGVHLKALQDVEDQQLRLRHFDHELTELIREGGNIPALWAYSSGVPTRLLGVTWLDEYQALVTHPAAPVQELAELAGWRVALPWSPDSIVDVARASAVAGFVRGLGTVGLALAEVQIVDVPREPMAGPSRDGRGEGFEAELDLLEHGAVDVVWLKGAAGVAAVAERGLRELMRLDRDSDPLVRVNNGTPRTLTVRQELLDQRPELLETYLEILWAAPGRVVATPGLLWEVLARETRQTSGHAELAYGRALPDSLRLTLAPARLEALQSQADLLFEHGFIPRRVAVEEWAAASPAGADLTAKSWSVV